MALATSSLQFAIQMQNRGRRRRRLRRPPVWLHPRQIERSYMADFGRLAQDLARDVRETLIAELPSIAAQAESELNHTDAERLDAWFDRVDELIGLLRIGATARNETARALAVDVGQKTNAWNDRQWQKTIKRVVGIDLFQAAPQLRDRLRLFEQTNVNLISTLQSDELEKIRGIVDRGFTTGKRHTTIAKEITEQFGVEERHARVIARDQVSKLNGQLTQMRQEEAGVTKYIWRDSDDVRVRTKHEVMDGKLARWDNASLYANLSAPNKWLSRSGISAVELHPGQDFQCRCFAEPFIQELADDQEEAA